MTAPSALQIAALMVCGSLLAGFGCFYAAEAKSAAGVLVFAAGLVALAYTGIHLTRRRSIDPVAPALPPGATEAAAAAPPAAQPRPTVPQSIALVVCSFLLFFFSCGGLVLSEMHGMSGLSFLTPIAAIGMTGGGVFAVIAIVLFVLALARRTPRPPSADSSR